MIKFAAGYFNIFVLYFEWHLASLNFKAERACMIFISSKQGVFLFDFNMPKSGKSFKCMFKSGNRLFFARGGFES